MQAKGARPRPKVVILGAGFGGVFAAQALVRAPADITVIDRHNYHLFQPLLYQVATAGLPPSDIAWPVRSMLRRQPNATVLMDSATGLDLRRRVVELRSQSPVPYDYLIIATGARHSYFGHDEWRNIAPGLKTIDDATLIRRRILEAFEQAEMTPDPAERERLLRFVIVGGGPTGVELAGALAELAHHTLAKDFRRIDPRSARIILAEAGPRVLPTFEEQSSRYAREALRRLRVDVRVGAPVADCGPKRILLGGEALDVGTVIWAAGVRASAPTAWLGVETDRSGRVMVKRDLSVPGHPEVFVIGDAAHVETAGGGLVPGIAPAAKQEGRFVAALIRDALHGRRDRSAAFEYRHAGNLATIGRTSAVIEFPRLRLSGWLAWWIWGIAHIYFLVGVPSPLFVSLRWLWQYLTYGRGARLITGAEHAD
jgi:NADH dehydrogenase